MDEQLHPPPQASRGDLIGAVGHELRNIVGAIMHQMELLSDSELDPSVQSRSRAALLDSFDDLNRFTDAFSDLERIERGELQLHTDSVTLADVFAVEDRSPISLADRDRLAAVLDGAASVRVDVDRSVLRRIVNILLSECHSRADEVSVAVVGDNGNVELTFRAGPQATPGDLQAVGIGHGLMPWVASLLAGAIGSVMMSANIGNLYTLSVPASASGSTDEVDVPTSGV